MPLPSATLPELPKQRKRLFLPTSTREFFMPTIQELQWYQVTSHRHQEGHYQTDDVRLHRKRRGVTV